VSQAVHCALSVQLRRFYIRDSRADDTHQQMCRLGLVVCMHAVTYRIVHSAHPVRETL